MAPRTRRDESPTMAPTTNVNKRAAQVIAAKVSDSSAALPAAGGSLDKVDEADSSESEGFIIENVTDEVLTGYCRAPNSDAHPHRP